MYCSASWFILSYTRVGFGKMTSTSIAFPLFLLYFCIVCIGCQVDATLSFFQYEGISNESQCVTPTSVTNGVTIGQCFPISGSTSNSIAFNAYMSFNTKAEFSVYDTSNNCTGSSSIYIILFGGCWNASISASPFSQYYVSFVIDTTTTTSTTTFPRNSDTTTTSRTSPTSLTLLSSSDTPSIATTSLLHHHTRTSSLIIPAILASPSAITSATTAVSSASSVISISMPSLASNGGRSQAVTSLLTQVASSNCNPLSDNNDINTAPPVTESPFQMSISNGGYIAGEVIGNLLFILIVAMVTFAIVISHPHLSNILSLIITISMMLLDSTFASIVSLTFTTLLWNILSPIIGVSLLLVIGYIFYRSLFKEEWVFVFKKDEHRSDRNCIVKLVYPQGEWNKNGNDNDKKQCASYLIEGYNDRFPRFITIEVSIIVAMAISDAFGIIGGYKGCIVEVIAMILILSVYLILCLRYMPFQEKLLCICIPIITFIQIVILIVTITGIGESKEENLKLFLSVLSFVLNTIMTFVYFLRLFQSLCGTKEEIVSHNVQDWDKGLLDTDGLSLPIRNTVIIGVRKEDVLSSITEPTSAPETRNNVKREHIETSNVWDALDEKTPQQRPIVAIVTPSGETGERYTVSHNEEIEKRRKSLSELLG